MSKYCGSLKNISKIVFVVLLSCGKNEKQQTVKITFENKSQAKINDIKIDTINMLSGIGYSLVEMKSDRDKIELKLTRSKFALLTIGKEQYDLYLEPGDKLNITIDTLNKVLHFEGKGADVNNYISKTNFIKDIFINSNKVGRFNYELKEILNKTDSFQFAMDKFHQVYIDSVNLSSELQTLLKKRNSELILDLKLIFVWKYRGGHNYQIPEILISNIKLPFDSILLKSGPIQYPDMSHIYLLIKYLLPAKTDKSISKGASIEKSAPFIVKQKIKYDKYPAYLEEWFLAKNVQFWITELGNSPIMDSLWFDYKNRYPNSNWTIQLEKEYNELIAIAPGKPALEISGLTTKETTLSLSQLKGNIVYVDVWATWCAPCLAEFPYSKKLQEKFKNNDKVKFLYVAVNDNKEKWKEMISSHNGANEIHIIEEEGAKPGIWEKYKIDGIPRFMLIDHNGLIVSAYTERPSSGKVEMEIEKLLLKL